MKDKILELREKGYSYTKIQEELKCSRGTISYHLGKGQKEKYKIRRQKNRKGIKDIIYRKLDLFFNRNKDNLFKYSTRTTKYEIVYLRIINNPYCYITGRKIDLTDSRSYSFDHILPFSISEDNSIDNLGLTCKDANQSKTNLTIVQYLELCKEVLLNNGYDVKKIT